MSYKTDLRDAELAVIRAAEPVAQAYTNRDGVLFFVPAIDDVETLVETLRQLYGLRSQLNADAGLYSDGDTSKAAAAAIVPVAGSLRRKILIELHRRRNYPVPGASDDVLERALKRAHTSVSAARRFLVQTGWVLDSGNRGRTCSGRDAKIWVLAPGAIDLVLAAIAMETP